MPRMKKSKSIRKRTYKRKKESKMTLGYNMYSSIIPNRMVTKLAYTENLNMVEGVTGFIYASYRANSIFDPNATAAGHQPLGHDQWAAFYGNYRVLRCAIKVEMVQNQSTGNVHIGITPSESLTITNEASEQPGAVHCLIVRNSAGPNLRTLGTKMDIRKFDGERGNNSTDSSQAAFGANPTDQKIFHVWAQNPTGGATVDVQGLVRLEYEVEMFNRVPLSAS